MFLSLSSRRYPTLFLGSYATSAPVLAEADDIQYLETVAISLGDVCTQQIAEGVAVVQEMLTANATSLAQIQHDFNLCAAPASEQDRGLFMTSFSGPVSGTVQYNGEGEGWNIPDVQQIMSNTSATAYENLLTLWQHYNVRGQGCANMNYEDYVQYYGSNPSDARSWYYQTCTEFGWFQTSDSTKQPFGDLFPIAWFDGLCADLFGVQGMKPDTVKVNQE
jgi:serine protease 16